MTDPIKRAYDREFSEQASFAHAFARKHWPPPKRLPFWWRARLWIMRRFRRDSMDPADD